MSKHANAGGSKKIGPRVRRLRKEAGETLQDVADAICSSKSQIWEIEAGGNKNPTIGTVMALARHFGTSVSYLVGEI